MKYSDLFAEFEDQCEWGSPVPSGKHTEKTGWREIPKNEIPPSVRDRIAMCRNLLRCGFRIAIKTANRPGRARFWTKPIV